MHSAAKLVLVALLACCMPGLASLPAVRPPDCELRMLADSAGSDATALATDAHGVTERQTVRDAAGNPVYEVRRDGTVIGREFDALNRLTSVWTLPAGTTTYATVLPSTLANAALRQTFEYDALSRLVRAVDYNDPTTSNDDRETRYAYDSLGRIVSETEDGKAVLSFWDARSNRCAVTYPSGRTVTVDYDAASRPVTVADSASAGAFDLEYDAASRLTFIRSAGVQEERRYYANGSETRRIFSRGTGGSYTDFGWLSVSDYDFRNLAHWETRTLPNWISSSTYAYDNRGDLTLTATSGAGSAILNWTLEPRGRVYLFEHIFPVWSRDLVSRSARLSLAGAWRVGVAVPGAPGGGAVPAVRAGACHPRRLERPEHSDRCAGPWHRRCRQAPGGPWSRSRRGRHAQ